MNIQTLELKLDRTALLERVAFLAGQVVLETPVKSTNAFQSYVRRSLIAEIEVALVAAGFDMKAARKRMNDRKADDAKKTWTVERV